MNIIAYIEINVPSTLLCVSAINYISSYPKKNHIVMVGIRWLVGWLTLKLMLKFFCKGAVHRSKHFYINFVAAVGGTIF